MDKIVLNSNNVIQECFKQNYFTEEMPPVFSANDFVAKIDEILKFVETLDEDASTYCTSLSIYKSEFTRRTISLPNPYSYLKLLQFIAQNWSTVLQFSKSKNSTSPIETLGTLSSYSFDKSRKLRAHMSFGYKYRLKIDLSNFYNSIYTHSITWAVLGKDSAKQFVHQKSSKINNPSYLFADKFDKLMRKCKGYETNGIIIGPHASRIFSEIILSGIDKLLRDRFQFVRFVDDYNFYFRTKQEAENALTTLHQVFNEFNLTLNKEKICIDLFPFEDFYDFNSKFNALIKESDGAAVLLRYALSLYEKGQKGALKYALKVMISNPISVQSIMEISSYIINIMMIKPDLAPLCLTILRNNTIQLDSIEKVINEEIPDCIKNKREQELLWYLYIIITLNVKVKIDNIVKVVKEGDDFSIILAMDVIKNHADLIIGENIDDTIREMFIDFAHTISSYDFYGEHWLLLYEIYVKKYIPNNILDNNKIVGKHTSLNKFFRFLRKKKIDFYKN